MSAATLASDVRASAWRITWAAVRAHRGSLSGTFLVIALAAALVSATGVLIESGARDQAGLLTALATSFAGTALLVVLLVVASTVTLALRQRRREYALLRAVGATRRQVRRSVAGEILLLTLLAAPIGAAAGTALALLVQPRLVAAGIVEPGFRLSLSPLPALAAVVLLAPVALLAARLAARETLRQPPTSAVRAADVEAPTIGATRRTLALATAAVGLAAAGSPLLVPGTIGSASAAVSALLLIGAAAIGGPILVSWLMERATRLTRLTRSPAVHLALANSRGFSRRLATAVVPLAVILSVGTVQASVDRAVEAAAVEQLRDGLRADAVATASAGFDDDATAAGAGAPGVTDVTPLGSTTLAVRTDDEELPGLAALSWETLPVTVLPADVAGTTYDPGIVAGSLAALGEPDTVAISSDARFTTGTGLGERVTVRLPGGEEAALRVGAVYERGLGFGDYLLGAATLTARGLPVPVDTLLVSGVSAAAVAEALGAEAEVRTIDGYIDAAVDSGAGERRLSLVLLLALLAFVGLAAANTLAMTTAARRDALRLLARTGATRRQLLAMAGVEALLVAGIGWLIGTAAVLPAIVGSSWGLLGPAVPTFAVTTYAVLSAAVLLIALVAIVPTARRPGAM